MLIFRYFVLFLLTCANFLSCFGLSKREKHKIHRNNANNNVVKTIKFEVCEGLTNQRIALIHGLLIAYVTDRYAVLPNIETSYLSNASHNVPFSYLFDVRYLMDSLKGYVKILQNNAYKPSGNVKVMNVGRKRLSPSEWRGIHADHIQIGCAFSTIDGTKLAKEFWRIDSALRFNKRSMDIAQNISFKIGGDIGYTALHFRIEQDWVEHCKKWENIGDKIIRDNCMTYTNVIGNVFKIQRIPTYRPLYIAGGFTRQFIETSPLFKDLRNHYEIVTKDNYFSKEELEAHMVDDREMFAAIDAIICAKATLFVGNSVSTFSALIELRRLQHDEPVFHYNAGNIPLGGMVPINHHSVQLTDNGVQKWCRLKWVFALSLYDRNVISFLNMAKVAIASAIENTSLDPICVLNIASSEEGTSWVKEVISWMESAGVTVIQHTPSFASKVYDAYLNSNATTTESISPLHGKYSSMLATYLRLDIPVLGITDDYVLYTDVDVYFDVDITIDDFNVLPKYLLMGFDTFASPESGNAGVILYNVQGMRRTYDKLIKNIFSDEHIKSGLLYGKSVDKSVSSLNQGALNIMYSDNLYPKTIVRPDKFNWRPYWAIPESSKTSIIHFHGPKPTDYQEHFENPNLDKPIYERLFKECDKVRNSCELWVKKWFEMHSRILQGYLPRFPR